MKITEVEPILLRGSAAYGSGAGGAEATDNGDWQLLIRVATDESLTGWSDVETLAPAAVSIIAGEGMATVGFQTLGSLLIGENPLDVERLWDKLYVGSAYYGRRGIAMHCISALDNCLWSIRAQAAGMSLSQLLGGRRRDKVMAYASTLFRSTPEGMIEAANGYIDKGYRAVKFGWGVFGQDPGRDRELVAAARQALGPDRHLMVDPGWYPTVTPNRMQPRSRADNEALCQWLGDYHVRWVEDFIHPEHFDEYAAVRASSPVPVAAGEQVSTAWEFARFIESGCVDVIQPDLTRCGGLTVAKQVAQLATRAGIDLVPHSWLTHLLTGYSLQLIATLPRARFVEFNVSQSPLTAGIAPTTLGLDTEGCIAIPDGVGIGIEVDTAFVDAHRVR
ncbi:MAG TPA: mandelate racemase/muconate lactonizing enzyme family protein [Devosia sp.]|jgi:L-alanine-DL-glutamate epimerase-like enolase superfamily enzyme|uniref:mandelate racemase/muconate lactonizing enzyme family protein n=1 Tax=Devosia sp. TaxID=1871048 RepID=UPI002DDD4FB0|nr:mandelate racemase/muconate lactonizing enzyme family protein [Devosia sp.]HEV2517354.1 mandelate racemase/muconate lactonizing enzyme family protein [Devosia sp.]